MSNNHVAEVNFDILEDIGAEGKNSDVFKILDTALNTEMVLKRVNKKNFQNADNYFAEARVIYHNQHPNIVEVNYACQDNDFVYVTMPYYRNGSLSNLMKTRRLTLREIIRYSVQFLSGLHSIHTKKLLHFDLKPDNILLSDRNEAMLSDFGLAKYMDEYGFSKPEMIYSKHIPPEAIFTKSYSTAFDIYQAGLTIYRMCVGSECFNEQFNSYVGKQGLDRERFKADLESGIFPDRGALPIHICSKVKKTILRCLEVSPDDRYGSALDIINEISEIDEAYLDWQYEFNGNVEKWSKKSSSGVLHCIEVDGNGKSTAYKIGTTGGRTNTSAYCKKKITIRDMNNFFKQKI